MYMRRCLELAEIAALAGDTAVGALIVRGDEVVGLIIGSFDADNAQEELQACIWRVNVSGTAQGRGVGRFAVHGLADEARKRGFHRLTVVYEPGEGSPEEFFRAVGFEVVDNDEHVVHPFDCHTLFGSRCQQLLQRGEAKMTALAAYLRKLLLILNAHGQESNP